MIFGWVAPVREPPDRWDLRLSGWTLCHGHHGNRCDCQHVLVCDTRTLTCQQRRGLAESDRPAWRLIMLGVEEPAERAALLALGCAEALGASTTRRELAVRAKRIDGMFGVLPRWRDLGPLTLDLLHRDARTGSTWLRLHPREFGVLWRLADTPGERVTRRQLLRDVWRMGHDPQTNSVEVHVSRLRSKLEAAGCPQLVQTAPEGGYRLVGEVPLMFPSATGSERAALDRYVLTIGWTATPARTGSCDELPQIRR
jgi:two-component system OmpR family response regulator